MNTFIVLRSGWWVFPFLLLASCEFFYVKKSSRTSTKKDPIARVKNVVLYSEDLNGIIPPHTSHADSITRAKVYINNWVRKQLLINKALQEITIDETELQRKLMDYRYSLISHAYQNQYIQQHLNNVVKDSEISDYYKAHPDNFRLYKHLIKARFIKIPLQTSYRFRLKKLITSTDSADQEELKSLCIRYSTAYYLNDLEWIEFDKISVNSPLAKISNKTDFLKTHSFYETSDKSHTYLLKITDYRVPNNSAPKEFARNEIQNVILNQRKLKLIQDLENRIYHEATQNKDFEIHHN